MNAENCEHEYEVLEKDIETRKITCDEKVLEVEIKGYVSFYCKKCLDIQKQVVNL